MPNVKIKQMGKAVSTSGIHMGGGRKRRKLEPGEVIYLDENDELFGILWGTGKLELTMEAPNRPLDFASEQQAAYCSPTFKPQSKDEAELMLDAHEEVMEILAAAAGPIKHRVPEAGETDEATKSEEPVEDVAALHQQIADMQAQLDKAMAAKAIVPETSRRELRRQRIATAQQQGESVEALP